MPRKEGVKKDKIKYFRQILEKRRDELTRGYRRDVSKSLSDVDDGIEDYVDYAVSSYTKEFLLSLSDLERRQLHLVERALRRLEEGDFGVCQECGEEINEKRLEAVPWARHCIRCQELEEQGLLPYLQFRSVDDSRGVSAEEEE